MPTLLQINPVHSYSTSTGRIMCEIGDMAVSRGWNSYIAFSGGRGSDYGSASSLLPVGGKLNVAWHALATRLLDRHGLASRIATRRFVKQIRKIKPDVVHIHNIHGYFLNYEILFHYLAQAGIKVIWTVHDCWLFTGHCYHYASVGCNKWKTECRECPQKRAFPASWLLDRSARNFADKKAAFTSVPDITFVTVSEWMRDEMKSSFLSGCRFKVIHNGIDTSAFHPSDTDVVSRTYGLSAPHIILAVSSIWLKQKGIDDIIRLAGMLNEDEKIVMVGRMAPEYRQTIADCPGIITIPRTGNVSELAALYSRADALINPTWQDNYPTVNMEAIACGTPVVTYRTGGSPESVGAEVGTVVEQGDVEAMLAAVRNYEAAGKDVMTPICRRYALDNFGKEDRYADYFKLYESSTDR